MSSKTNATVQGKASNKPASPRLVCIDIPEFLFQWILLQQPDWRRQPIAIVGEEKPSSPLLLVNAPAWRAGLRPGTRYAQALAQLPGLRGKAIPNSLRRQICTHMLEQLRAFSPQVSACPRRMGVFYAGLEGLQSLYKSWPDCARRLHRRLGQAGYRAYLGLGFTHLGTLALARQRPEDRTALAESPAREDEIARACRLDRLDLDERLLQSCAQLGLDRLQDFLQLPAESVLDRFGKEAYQLHRSARQELWEPIRGEPEILLWESSLGLEYAESNREGLLFLGKRLLDPLLVGLYRCGRAVQRLHLELSAGAEAPPLELTIGLSEPSLESRRLLDLLRLRLDSLELSSGITDLRLWLEDVVCPREQLELFQQSSRRELRAANRALDRIRADLGEAAVVSARLSPGHLPSAQFCWEPLERLQGRPLARPSSTPTLLRRHYSEPHPISPPRRLLAGPFRISGGWWQRETVRDYYYFVGTGGETVWGYYDQRRRSWYAQGSLE